MDLTHQFRRLKEALALAESVLLIAHQKPDGDALGSSTSFFRWLKNSGKNATLFCTTKPADAFGYLDDIGAFTKDESAFDGRYDAVVVFDSGDLKYAGVDVLIKRLPGNPPIYNIDHHRTNKGYGQMNILVTDATSTSEICYKFFKANGIELDRAMSTSLLTGILTDTSHFSNGATTSESLEIAGRLVAQGARMSDLLHGLVLNKQLGLLRLWGTAMSRLKINDEYDLASTYLKSQDFEQAGMTEKSTDVLINFLNGVCGGVDNLLVLNDLGDGNIKGSLRSVSHDVSAVAKLFGGGGHIRAAGFSVQGKIEATDKGFRVI